MTRIRVGKMFYLYTVINVETSLKLPSKSLARIQVHFRDTRNLYGLILIARNFFGETFMNLLCQPYNYYITKNIYGIKVISFL